jgi:hypothetical protein
MRADVKRPLTTNIIPAFNRCNEKNFPCFFGLQRQFTAVEFYEGKVLHFNERTYRPAAAHLKTATAIVFLA